MYKRYKYTYSLNYHRQIQLGGHYIMFYASCMYLYNWVHEVMHRTVFSMGKHFTTWAAIDSLFESVKKYISGQ